MPHLGVPSCSEMGLAETFLGRNFVAWQERSAPPQDCIPGITCVLFRQLNESVLDDERSHQKKHSLSFRRRHDRAKERRGVVVLHG